jgi:hypothetical protein
MRAATRSAVFGQRPSRIPHPICVDSASAGTIVAVKRKKPPAWFGKSYGKYTPQQWQEAEQQCRAELVHWARQGRPRTYGELVTLGRVRVIEHAAGR